MKRHIPARPNLEHLRSQAKRLLAQVRQGDPAAARTFIRYLPEAAELSPAQVRDRGFRLADAQPAIAPKSGFAAWPGLARHVDRLRRLEGVWAFRALEVDGSPMPAAMFTASRLLIDGDRFRMESTEADYEGIFTIDVEQTPHFIDIDFIEGPEAGNVAKGIFQLQDDAFTICLGLVGAERPQAFTTGRGSGHALEYLVRIEHARPHGVDGGTPLAAEPEPAPVADRGTAFDAIITPTLEKLQGEWLALEMITSGKPLEAGYLPYGSRTHSGVETKIVFGGQTMLHAKASFNESATPIEVDYLNLTGKSKGQISRGLFQWQGHEAVYCTAAPGAPRPADFSSPPGSGRVFSRWKRKTERHLPVPR